MFYTITYLIIFLLGSLAHSVTDVNVALAGASGGCYALIGAHIASVIVVIHNTTNLFLSLKFLQFYYMYSVTVVLVPFFRNCSIICMFAS